MHFFFHIIYHIQVDRRHGRRSVGETPVTWADGWDFWQFSAGNAAGAGAGAAAPGPSPVQDSRDRRDLGRGGAATAGDPSGRPP